MYILNPEDFFELFMERLIQWALLPLVFVVFSLKLLNDVNETTEIAWDGPEKRRLIVLRNSRRTAPKQKFYKLEKARTLYDVASDFGVAIVNPKEIKLLRSLTLRGNQKILVEDRKNKTTKISGKLTDGSKIELNILDGEILLERSTPFLITRTRDISGLVFSNFQNSLREANLGDKTINELIKLLGVTPKSGASYSLRVREELFEDGIVKEQTLEGFYVSYAGREFFKAKLKNSGQFLSLNDINATNTTWISKPVAGRVTSPFSNSRLHPILGFRRMHPAIDISAPYGTPVRAVGSGIVTFAGWYGSSGNMVKINHGNGIETVYRHLSKVKVKVKQKVNPGEIIGNVGTTGLATGPHLCFSVYVSGKPYDPLKFKPPFKNKLSAKDEAQLKSIYEKLKNSAEQIRIAQKKLSNVG